MSSYLQNELLVVRKGGFEIVDQFLVADVDRCPGVEVVLLDVE